MNTTAEPSQQPSDVGGIERAKFMAEGAAGPVDAAKRLRAEAKRFDEMLANGLELESPFSDDYGDVGPGEPIGFDTTSIAGQGAVWVADEDESRALMLKWSLDGCASLGEAAARLRLNADELEGLAKDGAGFLEPVSDGRAEIT